MADILYAFALKELVTIRTVANISETETSRSLRTVSTTTLVIVLAAIVVVGVLAIWFEARCLNRIPRLPWW